MDYTYDNTSSVTFDMLSLANNNNNNNTSCPFVSLRCNPTLSDMPPEILSRIAWHLSLCDLSFLARTCRHLHRHLFQPSELVRFLKRRYRLSIESGSLIIFAYLANIQVKSPPLLDRIFDDFFADSVLHQQEETLLKEKYQRVRDALDQSTLQVTRSIGIGSSTATELTDSAIAVQRASTLQSHKNAERARQKAKWDAVRMLGVLYALDKTHVGPSSSLNALVLSGACDVVEQQPAVTIPPPSLDKSEQSESIPTTVEKKDAVRSISSPYRPRTSSPSSSSTSSISSFDRAWSVERMPPMDAEEDPYTSTQGRSLRKRQSKRKESDLCRHATGQDYRYHTHHMDAAHQYDMGDESMQLPKALCPCSSMAGPSMQTSVYAYGTSRKSNRPPNRDYSPKRSQPESSSRMALKNDSTRRRSKATESGRDIPSPIGYDDHAEWVTARDDHENKDSLIDSQPPSDQEGVGSSSSSVHVNQWPTTKVQPNAAHERTSHSTTMSSTRSIDDRDRALQRPDDYFRHTGDGTGNRKRPTWDYDQYEDEMTTTGGSFSPGVEDNLVNRSRVTRLGSASRAVSGLVSNQGLDVVDSRLGSKRVTTGASEDASVGASANTGTGASNTDTDTGVGAVAEAREGTTTSTRQQHVYQLTPRAGNQQILNREDKIAFLTKYTDRMHSKLQALGIKDWSQNDIRAKKTYQLMIQHNNKTGEKDLVDFYLSRYGGTIPNAGDPAEMEPVLSPPAMIPSLPFSQT
ncbi:hypothetical protein BGZ94_003976 [Podila epigama]|nr:hypothetical protein BGZ94_003976 [Podila epigama]